MTLTFTTAIISRMTYAETVAKKQLSKLMMSVSAGYVALSPTISKLSSNTILKTLTERPRSSKVEIKIKASQQQRKGAAWGQNQTKALTHLTTQPLRYSLMIEVRTSKTLIATRMIANTTLVRSK